MATYHPLVVCTITYGNSTVTATNDGKTSPRYYRKFSDGNTSHAGHAEMRALSKMPRSLDASKVRVYVSRTRKDGSIAMSRPCVDCQAHLWREGVDSRRVWFTNDAGEYERFR